MFLDGNSPPVSALCWVEKIPIVIKTLQESLLAGYASQFKTKSLLNLQVLDIHTNTNHCIYWQFGVTEHINVWMYVPQSWSKRHFLQIFVKIPKRFWFTIWFTWCCFKQQVCIFYQQIVNQGQSSSKIVLIDAVKQRIQKPTLGIID